MVQRENWPGTERGRAGKEPGVLGAGSQSARSPTEWATGAWMSGMSGIGARVSCLNASRNGQFEQEPPVGDVVDGADGEKPGYPSRVWPWTGQDGETESGLGWQCGLGWYCVTWPGHGCYCPAEDCKGPSIYSGEVRQGQVAYREPKRPRPFRVRATSVFFVQLRETEGTLDSLRRGVAGSSSVKGLCGWLSEGGDRRTRGVCGDHGARCVGGGRVKAGGTKRRVPESRRSLNSGSAGRRVINFGSPELCVLARFPGGWGSPAGSKC